MIAGDSADGEIIAMDLLRQAFLAQQREHLRKKRGSRVLALEYFVAGLPPYEFFEMHLGDVRKILDKHSSDKEHLDPLSELCFIGLAAYFEAFCKDLFSAIVNIFPELLEQIAATRDRPFTITEVLHLIDGSQHRIGSILSEHYDWGSARQVNGIFQELLNISPFSTDEMKKYTDFLSDRNLLVHHGGVYTLGYAGKRFSKKRVKKQVHWQSIVVHKKDVLDKMNSLQDIAKKASLASARALEKFVAANAIKLDKERKRALKLIFPASVHGAGGPP